MKNSSSKSKSNSDSVEIMLPENLSSYLTPISILVGAILIAIAVFTLGGKLSSGGSSTDATDSADEVKGTTTTTTIDDIKALFDEDVITLGDKDSDLIFVEISDPSCPYCSIASGSNSALNITVDESRKSSWLQSNPDGDADANKSEWQFFTLTADGGPYTAPAQEMKKLVQAGEASYIYMYANGHGNGEIAAQALYCANDEGKFWEAHDLLMSGDGYSLLNEVGPTIENVSSFLSSIISENKIKDCLESGKYQATIASNESLSAPLMGGTPTFWVNDQQFIGAYGWDDMKGAL